MSTANTIGIDPAALFAIRDLELRARVVVEGLWSGLHRSPLEGFSVEFTEYRNYSPGDDLRYLDWKVLGRTDQEFIKKFEDETNLRCMILVDTSRSMKFASGEVSKAEYARTLAATLGYFLLQQRDVVGLGLIDRDLHQFLPARWRPGQFKRLLSLLSMESEGKETNLGNGLDQIGKLTPKRSLVMVISDFLSPPEEWEKSLGQLIAAGHDVRAIQILDSAELDLEFGKASQWEDLETGDQIYVDPNEARSAYKASFEAHQSKIRRTLEIRGIRHLIAPTNKPLDFVLIDLLRRQQLKGRVGL
jgi:uncharacterized protein (DUF58 family)